MMQMQEHNAPRRWIWPTALVLVTLLALGLRWYYVSTAMVIHPLRGDAQHYVFYAWNLVHHGVFSGNLPDSTMVIPDSYRDPGYPLLLAFWMKMFSTQAYWYAAVLLTQALLGALTVTLAMLLGRYWLSWPWVIGAGLLMAVWPHNITIASDLLTETLFGFLVALAMWLCTLACNRGSRTWAASAGLCFGAAALTNAVLLPFGILLALYLAWRRLVPRKVWLALLVGALILPGVWVIRNSQLPVQAGGHSSTGRALQNLVQGSWPSYHSAYIASVVHDPWGILTLDHINAETRLLQTSPRKGVEHMLQRMGHEPLRFVAWYILEKPYLLWDWRIRMGQNDVYVYPTSNSPFDTTPLMRGLIAICHTINPLLAALALFCLITTLANRWRADRTRHSHVALQSVLLLLVFVTVVYTLLQSEPRYSIPFRSFEMLLVMTACCTLMTWLRTYRHRAMGHKSGHTRQTPNQ